LAELATAEGAIDLAVLLHDARTRHQFSQQQAGALAGLSQQAVSRLERPHMNVTIGTVNRYLVALGYAVKLVVQEPSGDVVYSTQLGAPAMERRPARTVATRSAAG
jgi:transcriptional regulator with XRE-family HTH domain